MGSVPGRPLEGKDVTVMPGRREGSEQSRGADPGAVGGGIGEPGRDEQNLRRSALRPRAGRDRFLADNGGPRRGQVLVDFDADRKSTRLNSSHSQISYAVFCLKKK